MIYEFIKTNFADGTVVITLNRPQELNALNKAMVMELDQAFEKLAASPAVKAVIITGEKNFAAGADISNMVDLNPEAAKAFAFGPTFNKIENCGKPVIAAMEGYALGGGLELALACDLRIASPHTKVGFPEINLGIFPGAGGTQRLTRLIGPARTKEMIYTGTIIDAVKAAEYGILNLIAEDPGAEARQTAGKLAAKPAVALALAKQCINLALDVDARNGSEFEKVAWASTFATADQKEGMQAFMEKRKAVFTGK
jgi:Enoyl-CoA hydratase/carnithine racemase